MRNPLGLDNRNDVLQYMSLVLRSHHTHCSHVHVYHQLPTYLKEGCTVSIPPTSREELHLADPDTKYCTLHVSAIIQDKTVNGLTSGVKNRWGFRILVGIPKPGTHMQVTRTYFRNSFTPVSDWDRVSWRRFCHLYTPIRCIFHLSVN